MPTRENAVKMNGIVLSADSICDLGQEMKERYHVEYFPYHIIFRGVDYLDNVTITSDRIFEGYWEDRSLPTTAAINVGGYTEYFKSFVDQGKEVIHFTLGGALSSAYENAVKAAEDMPGVHIIDSWNLSSGVGQLVIRAGRLIEEGIHAEEIVERISGLRQKVHSSFIIDTLDFMAAGGRCPQVLAHVGKIIKMKPEILVDNSDGSMKMGKVYRGKLENVLMRYVEETLVRYEDIVPDDVFITHAGVDQTVAERVREKVLSIVPFERAHITDASCTISSHCGPGTLGILFVTETAS